MLKASMDACKAALNLLVEHWLIFTAAYLYFTMSCIYCEDEFGFNGQNYLTLDVTLGEEELNAFTLELRFKSYKKDGLILIQRSPALMQFYSVSLVNKLVVFWLNSSKILKIKSIHPIQYDDWNYVTLTKTSNLISLTLNGHPVIESEKLGGWLAQNQLSLSEELYLGGYHTPSLLTTESPTFLPFSGCVRELTFRGKKQWYSLYKEYRLSQDTVMQDKLRRGLLKSCDVTELCNFTITAKNLTANLNQLCHWPGSEVAITAEVVPNCSSDPQIAYQWTVHYLYGFFTTISEFSKYSVLSTTPLNRSSLILTVGNQQADLPIGVYGINLTVVLNSGINATAVTILGYFIVGCTDVTDLQDPDCSHIQDIITHDILISTKLSDTSHCKGQSVVTGGSYVHPTEFWELEQEARNILLNSSANTIIEHPSFQLKCLFNCEDKAVPGQTLLLQSLCDSCQSHTWTVYGCGTQCDVLIGPPQNGYNFTISVNESYEQQQIFYTGTYMSGRNVSAQYNLTVNLPPIPGNCTITPQSGYSLVTAFSVSCRGFTDPDLPLSYVIYQRRPSGMETELMKSDEALISPLYLSEGPKENNYTQRLTVKCMDSRGLMSATPITVQVNPVIGCLSNCEDKAVPGQTLLLQSLCDSCQSHTWTVYGCGTQCNVLIGPPQNGFNFTISVNESYEQQQIFYTGTFLSGRNVTVQYNLTVNLPPTPGNCTISPLSGYSLVTAFNVSCQGFTDPDLPLSYVIYQRQPSGQETELMKSDEPLISPLYLSEGPKEDNYTQRLTVKCMDSRGLMSATPITVQVNPVIGCLFNCEDKAVPGQTLLLQSLCDSCQSHTWTVYGCGTQCNVLIGPPQNGSNFTISVNESYEQQQIFYTEYVYCLHMEHQNERGNCKLSKMQTTIIQIELGESIKISGNAKPRTFLSGRNVTVQYNLTVNLPPTPGNCTISPQSGYSLVTAFNVSCQGFTDPDHPLSYVIYQRQPSGQETELMKSDEALISPLYLSEGQKEDNYTQRLTVKCLDSQGLMSATPITVQVNPVIGCLSNCEDKAVPGQTLLLQSLCDSCRSHTWTVYGCGTQCDVLIGPPQNGSNFSISVNESFEQQQIFYTGTSLSGRNMTVQYNLTVNLPPTQGNCTITPQSGYSLVTAFNVSCRGFTDPDLPLSYVIYQRQSSGKETELMKSDEALISPLYLSEGPKEDNYTQRLAVKCMDSRGLMSATPITVQIQPLERNPDESLDAIDVISESVLGNSTSTGILHDLLAAGKQSAVTQVLRSSVVTLNKDVKTTPGDSHRQKQRTEIRGALVAVLVNSSTGPPESININAITSVLNTATEVQEELSEETQDKALALYDGMTTAFSTQSANVTQSAAEATAGLLLEGITMLLDTKTKSGYEALHSRPANDTLERQIKSSAEKLLGTVDTITDVMMEFIQPDTKPSVFTTSKMNIALSKASPSQLARKKLTLNRGNDSGDFTIPADSKLSSLLSNTSYASIQVMLTDKNPFIWDLSSDKLTTPMVSLTLRNDQQQIINVTDLKDPVQILISNANPTVEKSEENFTINAASFDSFNSTQDDLCRVLNLNVMKGRSNILTIQPLTFNLTISAMEIQNGTNVSHYDITSSGISLNKYNNFTHIFTSLPSGVVSIGFCIDQTMDNYKELNKGCLSLTSCVLTLTLEIQGYSAVCMYWNVSGDAWSSNGCQVGRRTTPETIQCECNHLTAFSGSFFVAPNFVDPFRDVALFLTFFSNPVVVSTVLIIWLIYFTLLTWATKQDRRDMFRGGVIMAHENDQDNKYAYLVCVITGWWKDAGTTANVSLSFTGTRGHSARHCLSESVPGRQCFMSGSEDWFLITTSHSLGDIKSLSVWHDNSGKSPAWYLSRILIEDLQSHKTWTFLYSDWISVDRGSVSLKITLQSCSDEELMSHKNQQFFFKSSRDLRDSHLWLSIASKPSYSTFTRVQRLSCALCLLLMTMLTSLMFHGIPTDDPADQAKVGYLTISLSDLAIGVQSGLIMFPVNILIIQLFLKSKRKPRGGTQVKKKPQREEKYSVVSVGTDDGDQATEKEMEPAKEDGILPWWTVYIAWTLVITLSVVSSYFVMLYGLKFGYRKSVEWLVSFFTAFFQSAFVTQPLKVIAISLIFTMILKKPVEIQGGKASTEEKKEQYGDSDRRQGYYVPDPLSQRLMNRIRKQLKLEEATQATLRDIMLYLTFIICVIFMAHGHKSVRDSYRVHEFLENTFVQPRHPPIYIDGSGYSTDILELGNVANVELFWSYIQERIVPVLGEMSLGNSTVASSVSEYFLLGWYRLRQVRIKQDTCAFPDVLRKSFSIAMDCTGEYWVGDEDTGDYNMTWRKPLPTKVKSIPDTWSHRSSWKLKTIPYEGRLATYSGGGYTVVLAGNITRSMSVIQDLQNSDWIDHRTRAVFIEFTTYNANVNLFSVIMILFEFSNIGAIFPSYQIFTTKLYGYDNGLEIFTAVCEVFFVIFTLTFSYIEIRKLYYEGKTQYFSDPWSFVEIIQIILSFSVIGLFFQRFVSVSNTLSDYLSSTEFVSFYTAVSWDMILNYVMAFLVGLVILKFFKFLKFNARMYLLSQTLSIAKPNLIGFSIIVFVVVAGFGHFSVLTFGPFIEGFMDMGKTLVTLFRLALGESDFPSLYQAHRYLGPVFFFLYIFLVQWTVLVVFIAILNFAIEEAKRNIAEMRNKLEVVNYIYNKMYQLLPRCS